MNINNNEKNMEIHQYSMILSKTKTILNNNTKTIFLNLNFNFF